MLPIILEKIVNKSKLFNKSALTAQFQPFFSPEWQRFLIKKTKRRKSKNSEGKIGIPIDLPSGFSALLRVSASAWCWIQCWATSASHAESDVVAVARTNTAAAGGEIPIPVGTADAGWAVVPTPTSHKVIAHVLERLRMSWV